MTLGVLAILSLRGAAAVFVLTSIVSGIPRIAQAGLALATGLWTALMVVDSSAATDLGWIVAARELVLGAALGVIASLPLVAAATAGRLVDRVSAFGQLGTAAGGPYAALFAVLAAAVFVGLDGHVMVIRAVLDSHRALPSGSALVPTTSGVLATLGALMPAAIRLAIPWLLTAAIVELAAGAGVRVAGRSGRFVPAAAAAPAALVMITASLVATFAIALAQLAR